MSRDEYYVTRGSRVDTLAGPLGREYYDMLMRLNAIYQGKFEDWQGFADWCDSEHGFRPSYNSGGGITLKPNITDEQKYTLCLLKYSG